MKKFIAILMTIILTLSCLSLLVGCSGTKGLAFELGNDGESYIVTGFIEDIEEYPDKIVIPEKHKGKPVTKLGAAAFRGRTEITTVELPDTITEISTNVFKGCSSLTEINLPDSITMIGMGTFEGCKKLASITLPSGITNIPESLFNGCESLTEITIPNGVKTIGTKSFTKSGVKKIELPDSVKEINEKAFVEATGLEEFVLGDGVEDIGSYVFDNCTSLKKVTLGSGLKTIKEYAFNECSALEEITIPSTVRAIYGYAFEGCVNLRRMVFEGIEDSMIQCSNPACGVTICPASMELGFTTHYHSTYWLTSEQGGSAFAHYHWIFSHDLSNPEEAWKYFVKDSNGKIQAGAIHNHALGGQPGVWSEEDGVYKFNGATEWEYGGEMLNVHEDISGWLWMDASAMYWYNGTKGEY